ncbi:hypothetical protein Fmac_012251 [Flemingia macrophylla]|uniref:Uncharacterized protein n=1 Tax=Flemingia macrophylla TaxID=520843 RepID=A0ABD1MRV3_9FABA
MSISTPKKNQIVERIAAMGMIANFMVYLLKVFNLGQVAAANVIGICTGGMLIITLTAWLPQLHPPTCTSPPQCVPSTRTQLGVLIVGLCWLAVGTGGIAPCSIPFSIDQFDTTSPEGRKGVNRLVLHFSGTGPVD